MGSYLNPGNKGFRESLNSQIYVDKSGLIERTNAVSGYQRKVYVREQAKAVWKIDGRRHAGGLLWAGYRTRKRCFKISTLKRVLLFGTHLNKYNVAETERAGFSECLTSSVEEMLGRSSKNM